MGRAATKAVGNVCFQARKLAALDDERLNSREGAAELLNIHPTTLADYELGNVKSIPAEMMVRMSEVYRAPWLMTWFCETECPIGSGMGLPVEMPRLERLALDVSRHLSQENVERFKRELIEVACEGLSSEEEKERFRRIAGQASGWFADIVGVLLMKRMMDYG